MSDMVMALKRAAKQAAKRPVQRHLPHVWNAWLDFKRPRSAEIELAYLPRLVQPDAVSLDIGANRGLYAKRLARLSRQVHAFEPTAIMADMLRRTMPPNVTVHQLALSAQAGSAEIHIPVSEQGLQYGVASLEVRGARSTTEIVRLARLDDMIDGAVHFVKIDVEGHELAVLQGAPRLIGETRPLFLVEVEDRHRPGATASIFSLFADAGYSGWFLHDSGVRPAADFDVASMQNAAVLLPDGGRKPGQYYINNFWFFPVELADEAVAKLARA